MSTRSLVILHDDDDNDGKETAVLYVHYDGYPTGVGANLRDFLAPIRLVNGTGGSRDRRSANGAACLLAQIVAHLKTDTDGIKIGDVYLYPAGMRDMGEGWIYHVYPGHPHRLVVREGGMTAFGFSGEAEDDMHTRYDGPINDFDPEAPGRGYRKADEVLV